MLTLAPSVVRILFGLSLILGMAAPSLAQENRISIRGTNLDIPRFVSLKTNLVNMRAGPGKDYPIKWQYKRQGLPVKIVGEFDVWRKVMDHEDVIGWMHVSTLSVKRLVLIMEATVKIHKSYDDHAPTVAVAEKGVIAELERCRPDWCKIKTPEISGWISRSALWGVLEDEPAN